MSQPVIAVRLQSPQDLSITAPNCRSLQATSLSQPAIAGHSSSHLLITAHNYRSLLKPSLSRSYYHSITASHSHLSVVAKQPRRCWCSIKQCPSCPLPQTILQSFWMAFGAMGLWWFSTWTAMSTRPMLLIAAATAEATAEIPVD